MSLFGCNLTQNNVLIVTDGASYNKLAIEGVRKQFPSLKLEFVTCLAHMVNRVLCKLQEISKNAMKLIKSLNAIMKNSIIKRRLFGKVVGCRFPKICFTRWGTFVSTCKFLQQRRSKILQFTSDVEKMKKSKTKMDVETTEPSKIQTFSNTMKDENCWKEIEIVADLDNFISIITNLQRDRQKCSEQIGAVERLAFYLETKNEQGTKERKKVINVLVKKLNDVITKNFGFKRLRIISSNNLLPAFLAYAPLTTVEVERSFSILHWMIDERRSSLNDDTLDAMLMIHHDNMVRFS